VLTDRSPAAFVPHFKRTTGAEQTALRHAAAPTGIDANALKMPVKVGTPSVTVDIDVTTSGTVSLLADL